MSNNKNPIREFKLILQNGEKFEFKLKDNSFRNLISKEDFSNLNEEEKQQFYLIHKIYLPDPVKYSKEYILKLKKENRFFRSTHKLNPPIKKEIIEYYLNGKESFWENDYQIKQITNKLNNSLNIKHKVKIIETEYKKYFKKLHKNELSFWYFLDEKSLTEHGYINFLDYFEDEIEQRTDIVNEFITEIFPNFWSFDIFKKWNEIERLKGVLEFLKNYENENIQISDRKIKITNEQQQINNNSTTDNNIEKDGYLSRVFRSIESENILYETLKELNVLTNNDFSDNGFQSICESFWKVANYNSLKQYILKDNVKKKHFIDHLNNRYNANIKDSAKGRLSYKEENNYKVESFIKTYIKFTKRT